MHDQGPSRPAHRQSDPRRWKFEGRILYLLDDAELVKAQLYEGHDVELTPELKERLRDQISTDEITPGLHLLLLRRDAGRLPVPGAAHDEPDDRRDRVPGRAERRPQRRLRLLGSRQAAGQGQQPRGAARTRSCTPGIQVVIAESIERIYNENCQNLGILTTTDFGMIERIRAGEEIQLAEFTEGKDDDHPADHRVRRSLRVQRGPAPGQGVDSRCRAPTSRTRRPAPDDDRREDLRAPLVVDAAKGDAGRALGAAGRRRLLPDRHPLQPRVRDADGRDLLRGEGGPGRARWSDPRLDPLLPRPPHVPATRS